MPNAYITTLLAVMLCNALSRLMTEGLLKPQYFVMWDIKVKSKGLFYLQNVLSKLALICICSFLWKEQYKYIFLMIPLSKCPKP